VLAVAPEDGRIGLELSVLPESSFARLRHRLPNVTFIEAGDIFDDLRAIKDPDEIAHLRLAGELTEIGISGAIDRLRPGHSVPAVNALYQIAVHEEVVSDAKYAGFRQAEGAASIGMGVESPGVVAPGQTIKFDMQVDVAGYHSDIGRTVAISPTADQLAVYSALRNALAAAQELVRPGVKLADVHAAGTQAMIVAGFGNYSRGHLGHSVGLTQNFEEPPFIAADEYRRIVPGMVLSLELPYYLFGVGAFQLERMLLVTEDGHEAMDQLPFELSLADR
jgi:Xaa-Pro aminopeptidase